MGEFRFGGQAAGAEGVEFLAANGFDFADINLNELEKVEAEAEGMLAAASGAGMFFVAHAPDKRVDDDEGLAEISAAIRAAAPFRPRTVTVHPILASPSNTPEIMERKLREIGTLSRLAMENGTRLSLENTAEAAPDFSQALAAWPDVVLTVDVGHSELLSEQNKAVSFIEAWPDRIGHVHMHDNIGGDTYYEDLHLPLGEGQIDFAPIMRALAGLDGEVTITFEMPRQKAV